MSRVVVRVYLGVLLTFVVTTGVVLGVFLDSSAADIAVVEWSLRGGARLAGDAIAAAPAADRDRTLARLEETFGYPIETLAGDHPSVPEHVRQRARGAGGVAYLEAYHGEFLFASLPGSDDLVRFGPLPEFAIPGPAVLGVTFGAVVLLWALVTVFLLAPSLRSMRSLERAADAMVAGDFGARVAERGDPNDRVARSFNRMAAQTEHLLESHRDLLQAVTHEFRAPLARLRFAQEMLSKSGSTEEQRHLIAGLDLDLDELDVMVDELLSFLRLGHEAPRPAAPIDAARHIAALCARLEAQDDRVQVVLEAGELEPRPIVAEPRLFERALGNLLANAHRFARRRVFVRLLEEADHLIVLVDDDGPGIPEADRRRVLAPFVRLGRGRGNGAGLGLAIAERVVRAHGGSIELEESPEGGCRVRTRWPLDARTL